MYQVTHKMIFLFIIQISQLNIVFSLVCQEPYTENYAQSTCILGGLDLYGEFPDCDENRLWSYFYDFTNVEFKCIDVNFGDSGTGYDAVRRCYLYCGGSDYNLKMSDGTYENEVLLLCSHATTDQTGNYKWEVTKDGWIQHISILANPFLKCEKNTAVASTFSSDCEKGVLLIEPTHKMRMFRWTDEFQSTTSTGSITNNKVGTLTLNKASILENTEFQTPSFSGWTVVLKFTANTFCNNCRVYISRARNINSDSAGSMLSFTNSLSNILISNWKKNTYFEIAFEREEPFDINFDIEQVFLIPKYIVNTECLSFYSDKSKFTKLENMPVTSEGSILVKYSGQNDPCGTNSDQLQDSMINLYSDLKDGLTSSEATCTTYFPTTRTGTWPEAKNFCQSVGLEMATIRNRAENNLLNKDNYPQSWIGGERDGSVFRWYTDGEIVCPYWDANRQSCDKY